MLPPGKVPPELLAELLRDPELPPEVRLGPRVGEDACAIEVPAGTLIAATDPITLTGSDVGAHAVWINANDVAVMGAAPRWFLASVLLPPGSEAEGLRELFAGMRAALRQVGAALVGGHTEVTAAVGQPLVVGQMLGLLPQGQRFVPTGGVRPGDAVVQAGAAPVEAASVLAAEAAAALGALPPALLRAARAAVREPGISVVAAALCAAQHGASALHDPTEGGLVTGLRELASASGVALRVDPGAVIWFEPGLAVCRALGADPFGALASGALLAAFPPERLAAALAALGELGPARVIARAEAGGGVHEAGGGELPHFARDEVARVLEGSG